MHSEIYKQIRNEIREKRKNETLSKKNVIFLEQTIFKELPQKCVRCGKEENLTLDHIIPKDILRSLGIDIEAEIIEGNYHILCKTCNIFKGNRLDFSYPETKEILLKLINNL